MLETPFLEDLERRRKEILSFLGDRLLIIAGSHKKVRNNDVFHPFRQDNDFLYLTGFPEPDSVVIFDPLHESENLILFVRKRDKFKELWDGFRYGVEGAKKYFYPDEAYPLEELEMQLLNRVSDRDVILLSEEGSPHEETLYTMTEGQCKETDEAELLEKLAYMRSIKSDWEISCMRQAAMISTDAHHAVMRRALIASHEHNLHAEFTYYCHNQGAESLAYPPIVASGVNATCLHYSKNNKQIDRSGLILIDAGCEVNNYASDITRTFPASGHFSKVQRDCYEMVLRAQKAALDSIGPGMSLGEIHQVAVKSMVGDMIEIGLIRAGLDEALGKGLHADYFPHGTSHWLGMDVHDVGPDAFTKLIPGMSFTVEPGFYVQPYNEKAPEEFRGIGIRIEDNVVITKNSCEILTSNCVKEISEVEAMILH